MIFSDSATKAWIWCLEIFFEFPDIMFLTFNSSEQRKY